MSRESLAATIMDALDALDAVSTQGRMVIAHAGIIRDAVEAIRAALAHSPALATGEVQYRGKIGHIIGEPRVHPEGAKDAALDALSDYPFEFPERYDDPVIEQRAVTPWVEVTP